MGDLISRSSLIETLRNPTTFEELLEVTLEDFSNLINEQPTAYNVENVVAELEKEIQWAETHGTSADFRKGRISGLKTAIRVTNDIVKRGGADERT